MAIYSFKKSYIHLNIANALWIRGTNQNKITWHFIILTKPHYITNMNILCLDLQMIVTTRNKIERESKQLVLRSVKVKMTANKPKARGHSTWKENKNTR